MQISFIFFHVALGNIKLFNNLGLAVTDFNISIETQIITVEEVFKLEFQKFETLNATCNTVEKNKADVFMSDYDSFFVKAIKKHVESYFIQPRSKRDIWNVVNSAVNIVSQVVLHNKIRKTTDEMDYKLESSLKLVTNEFSLLRSAICNELDLFRNTLSYELANIHIVECISKLDNIIFSFQNNIRLDQNIHRMQLKTCSRFNSPEICSELVLNNKIKNRVLAIEHVGHTVYIQVITKIPSINRSKIGFKTSNFGVLSAVDNITIRKSLIGISLLYLDSHPIDINQCTYINREHIMCYLNAVSKIDMCFHNILNGNDLSDCTYESGSVPYSCTVMDLQNFYILQNTHSVTLLSTNIKNESFVEYSPGNHLIAPTDTSVIACDETYILHPPELILGNISIVNNSYNMSTAHYIDRDLINLLQNSELNLSDADLLHKSLKEILDYKVNDNFDIVTILILLGASFFVIFFCMGYLLYKNKKEKKVPFVV